MVLNSNSGLHSKSETEYQEIKIENVQVSISDIDARRWGWEE